MHQNNFTQLTMLITLIQVEFQIASPQLTIGNIMSTPIIIGMDPMVSRLNSMMEEDMRNIHLNPIERMGFKSSNILDSNVPLPDLYNNRCHIHMYNTGINATKEDK